MFRPTSKIHGQFDPATHYCKCGCGISEQRYWIKQDRITALRQDRPEPIGDTGWSSIGQDTGVPLGNGMIVLNEPLDIDKDKLTEEIQKCMDGMHRYMIPVGVRIAEVTPNECWQSPLMEYVPPNLISVSDFATKVMGIELTDAQKKLIQQLTGEQN